MVHSNNSIITATFQGQPGKEPAFRNQEAGSNGRGTDYQHAFSKASGLPDFSGLRTSPVYLTHYKIFTDICTLFDIRKIL
jgi:hypothetical protein